MPAPKRTRQQESHFTLAFTFSLFLLCANALAQTDTTIYSFTGAADGEQPVSSLIADSSGNYYGTAFNGGSYAGTSCMYIGCGVVYKLSPNGAGGWNQSVIYSFTGGADGGNPAAGLIFDSVGNLYGTAAGGGINGSICSSFGAPGCGVVYKLSPSGSGGWTQSVLYSFQGNNDGWYPEAPLTFDAGGNLYGTTSVGGAKKNCAFDQQGCGEIFKLTPNGSGGWTYSVLHFFTNGPDGGRPYSGVAVDGAGNVFATPVQGGNASDCTALGSGGCGVVVELSPASGGGYHFRVLHTFSGGADGAVPFARLTLDAAGNLYGAASTGGRAGGGVCKEVGGCGVVFEEDRSSSGNFRFSLIYSFKGLSDGYSPTSSFAMDSGGSLYGVGSGSPAGAGGGNCQSGCGFVYKLSPPATGGWSEDTLYAFTDGTDGGAPFYNNPVTLDASGNLFGTAPAYGIPNGCAGIGNGCGVAYEITP